MGRALLQIVLNGVGVFVASQLVPGIHYTGTWGFLLVINPFLVTFFQLRLTERVSAVPAAVKLAVGLPDGAAVSAPLG